MRRTPHPLFWLTISSFGFQASQIQIPSIMRAVPYFLSTLLVLSHITCTAPVDGSLGIVQRTSAENTEGAEDTSLDPGLLTREAAAANAIAVHEETKQTENTSSDSMNNPVVFIRADAVKGAGAAVASPTANNPGRII